jgi:hypothetical protein
MTRARALVAASALIAAGCVRSADEPCVDDADCDGEVCARDGVCLAAGDVRRVQIRWTVRGAAPDATACEGIAELELQLDDSAGGPGHRYAQVPCPLGLFTIDKIGRRYDGVTLAGYDAAGSRVVRGTAPITDDAEGDGAAMIDLASSLQLRISVIVD